ncbi:MAG: CapA family protein [Bacteroidetes bacterium]|nr:CapA family protein [Bacteroidota bacterium]
MKKIAFLSISPALLVTPITLLLLSKPGSIHDESHPGSGQQSKTEVSLLFIGDIMQHMPQVDAAWNDSLKAYTYDSTFQYISPFISGYDIAIANLETTLAGKPYSGYPAFSSPDELVTGMLHAGIDIVGTANNHCCDRGKTGIERTIEILDSLGLKHLGTYRNAKEFRDQNPMILQRNGISLALLNYTFGTNGIPVPEGNIVSLIDKPGIERDLEMAKKSKPDKIIIFMHWGDEYQREPNAYQKEFAGFCFGHGADIIIGSHPHVLQRMEWIKNDSLGREKLVAWSLGNSVSNQRKRYTDGGAMIGITLQKMNGETTIEDASYQLTWVYNPIRYGKRQYYILPVDTYENDSILVDRNSMPDFKTFISDSRDLLNSNVNVKEKHK